MIAHHLGGIIPYFEGRVAHSWDQLGARTSDEDYALLLKRLKKRPYRLFQGLLRRHRGRRRARADRLRHMFFGADHVLFASDCPFDKEKGPGYIRATIEVMESLELAAGRQGEDLPRQCGNHVRAEPALNEDSQVDFPCISRDGLASPRRRSGNKPRQSGVRKAHRNDSALPSLRSAMMLQIYSPLRTAG